MEDSVVETVAAIKALAPEVWAIMLKQVWIEAYAGLAIPLFIAVVLLPFFFWLRRKWNEYDRGDRSGDGYCMAFIGVCFFGGLDICVFIGYGIEFILVYMNPEYYAIQLLIG